MSSSDDDEPLAVVAEKVKQKSEVIDKSRSKTNKAKKRKIETDPSESESEESDHEEKRRRRKRKPPLEDEFDSDEIPLGDMSDKDEVDEKDSDEEVNAKGQQEESSPKQKKDIGGSEDDEAASNSKEEDDSNKEGNKPSISSPNDHDIREKSRKDEQKLCKSYVVDDVVKALDADYHAEWYYNLKRKVSTDSSTRDSADVENKSSSSDDESDKKSKGGTEREEEEKDSDDSDSQKAKRTKKKKSEKAKTSRHHGTSSEEDEEEKGRKKSGKRGRPKKEKGTEASQSPASIRLAKLKKMVTLAGFRIVYKKLFEDIGDSDRQRVKALEKEMERRGLTPPFTIESCKAFKLQKEQEAELAELAKNQIIEIGDNPKGRVTRAQRSAALASKRRGGIIFEDSSDEDNEELEESEHMKEETRNLFKNLRGIVSDDADSD